MATLYITEYAGIMDDRVQIPIEPPLVNQTVAIGASSAQSAPFAATTRVIRISTDAICSVLIGVNPTATASDGRFAANQTEFRGVSGGQILAVITNT